MGREDCVTWEMMFSLHLCLMTNTEAGSEDFLHNFSHLRDRGLSQVRGVLGDLV